MSKQPPPTPQEVFPVYVYPEQIQNFIVEAAEDIGCPFNYLAAGVLPAVGSALGSDCRLVIGGGWEERPCFWMVFLGESGIKKNPAIKCLVQKHRDLEAQYSADFRNRLEEWQALDEGERRGTDKPVRRVVFTSDTTVQAVRDVLVDNPQGILFATGEVLSWLNSMGQYSNGKTNADRQQWLDIYSEDPMAALRVGRRDDAPLVVPRPFVGILGGIQPGVLNKLSGKDGLLARLIIVPGTAPEDVGLPSRTSKGILTPSRLKWNAVLDNCFAARQQAVRLYLSDEAYKAANEWVIEHKKRYRTSTVQEQKELASKVEGMAFRVCIVLWALDRICEGDQGYEVSLAQWERAVEVVDWVLRTAEVALGMVETATQADDVHNEKVEQLSRWFREHAECPSKSYILQHGPSGLRNAAALDAALESLGWTDDAKWTGRGRRMYPTEPFMKEFFPEEWEAALAAEVALKADTTAFLPPPPFPSNGNGNGTVVAVKAPF